MCRGPQLWSTSTWEVLRVLHGHASYVHQLAAVDGSPTSTATLVSCSADRTLRIWNIDRASYGFGECTEALEGHRDSVYCLAPFADVDGAIGSGSADTTVMVWLAQPGRPVRRLRVLRGHTRPVVTIAAAGNGRLVSLAPGCSIRLWDATGSGTELKLLTDAPVIVPKAPYRLH